MSPTLHSMDDVRAGVVVRALRRRRGWTQRRLASEAQVAQSTVSLVERGQIEAVGLPMLRRVLRSLEARVLVDIRWRGGELDRLVDEAHARLVATIVERLRGAGWETEVEVGERGSIDVVGWRGLDRALVVVEVKSDLTAAEATLRKLDEKVRLGARIVAERFGWRPRTVSRMLVLPESRTARRRVEAGGGLVARSFPVRGDDLRAWLRRPEGAIAGLIFLANIDVTAASRRIRPRRGDRLAPDHTP
jgi:transcriptional regulator with XRE-family HTH domain